MKAYQALMVPAAVMVGGGLLSAACEGGSSRAGLDFKVIESLMTGHPNSPEYKGGSLESFTYFKTPGGSPLPTASGSATITGVLRTGTAGVALEIPLTVTHAGVDPAGPRSETEDKCVAQMDVHLYKVEATFGGKTVNLCQDVGYPVPHVPCEQRHQDQYKGVAIAAPGYWDDKGDYHEKVGDEPVYTLSCMNAAVAKCVHWGYRPWDESFNHKGKKLKDFYKACVLASRAEYNAAVDPDDSRAFTCPGVYFDIDDVAGIQRPEKNYVDKSWPKGVNERGTATFESRWDENGTVCSARGRFETCDHLLRAPVCAGNNTPKSPHDPDECQEQGQGTDWKYKDRPVLLQVRSFKHDGLDYCPVLGRCKDAPPFVTPAQPASAPQAPATSGSAAPTASSGGTAAPGGTAASTAAPTPPSTGGARR